MNRVWLKNYQDLVVRTKWIGVIGAVIMLLLMLLELRMTIFILSVAEVEFSTDLIKNSSIELIWTPLIALAFSFRIIALWCRPSYGSHFVTWISAAIPLTGAIIEPMLMTFLLSAPVCTQEVNKICFGTFAIARTSPIPFAALLFLFSSGIRSLVTARVVSLTCPNK